MNQDIGLPASDLEQPITWLQVTINAVLSTQQIIETCFEQHGAMSITLADGEDTPIFEPLPGETPLWPSLLISGLFELPTQQPQQSELQQQITNNIAQSLQSELGQTELVCSLFEDEEWVRTCLQDFVPIDVGQNFWIVPTWLETPATAKIALKLDPGLAFGTGTHPTTFLCLAWLATQAGLIKESTMIVDYGCGSGILAIGAALLGAQRVLATDIDGQALLATNMNADKNQVVSKINTMQPKQLHAQLDDESVDIVVANILAEPLLNLAPRLANLIKPSGLICLSGLLERHQKKITEAYSPYFTQFQYESRDGWSRVTAVKLAK